MGMLNALASACGRRLATCGPIVNFQETEMSNKDEVQGEGDYKSAKKFQQQERDFVKSGAVEKAAHEAEPKSEQEARDMQRAESIGRSHSKGEDRDSGASGGGEGRK
jgi:hypothetical protein